MLSDWLKSIGQNGQFLRISVSPQNTHELMAPLPFLDSWHLAFGVPHIAGFSIVSDFPADSGGPAAVKIAAAVIPDVALGGFTPCCC
jgi:hypothetical protein